MNVYLVWSEQKFPEDPRYDHPTLEHIFQVKEAAEAYIATRKHLKTYYFEIEEHEVL